MNWKNSAQPPDGDSLSPLRSAIHDHAADKPRAAGTLLHELAKIDSERPERSLEALSLLADSPRTVVRLR